MPTSLSRHRHQAYIAQSGRCYYCGEHMWEDDIESFSKSYRLSRRQARLVQCTAEHLHARQDGGTNTRDNIVAACKYCNQRRHKRKNPPPPETYRQFVRSRVQKGKWHQIHVASEPTHSPCYSAALPKEPHCETPHRHHPRRA